MGDLKGVMEEILGNLEIMLAALRMVRDAKSGAGDGGGARHVAVTITELEKAVAYYRVYVVGGDNAGN